MNGTTLRSRMTHFALQLPAPLLCALGLSGCRGPSSPWFFVVGADPQLYMKQEDDRYWRQTVAGINRLRPDFVIVCGDLIHGENNAEKWPEAKVNAHHEKLARDFWTVAKELQVPLKCVAGNHDVGLQPTPFTIAWYTERFGKPWYSFEHKNSLFIVLESNLLRDAAGAKELAAQQEAWFRRTVEASSAKAYEHKTVYMHHPMCLATVREKDGYFNMPLQKRLAMISLLKRHGFDAVFCGHYHRNAVVKDGDLEMVTTASCCAPLGKDPRGLRVVKVYPDRLEHAYYPIEKLPEKVVLDRRVGK